MTPADEALAAIATRVASPSAEVGLVLGTGLGMIAESLEQSVAIPYAELPGFPAAGVSGHGGTLHLGLLEGVPVALCAGRAHTYEAGDPAAMRVPIETMARLGVRQLVLTNAAGSLHPGWNPGSLVLISDHINLTGLNPLIGDLGDDRFVRMADAYDRPMRVRLKKAASQAGIPAPKDGVYMWFVGPSFETPAEIRAAKALGADLVGMSTVPETILARRLGLRVAAISIVTNLATGIGAGNPSHEETKDVALRGSIGLRRLLRAYLRARDDV